MNCTTSLSIISRGSRGTIGHRKSFELDNAKPGIIKPSTSKKWVDAMLSWDVKLANIDIFIKHKFQSNPHSPQLMTNSNLTTSHIYEYCCSLHFVDRSQHVTHANVVIQMLVKIYP